MKLNLACGFDKRDGYVNVDWGAACKPDVLANVLAFPWRWEENSVEEILAHHFIEHIPHQLPGHQRDGFFVFMDECYRVLAPGGKMDIRIPCAQSVFFTMDPTHTRMVDPMTFRYCDAEHRERFRFKHYPVMCDFSMEGVPHADLHPYGRDLVESGKFGTADQTNEFARRHLFNHISEYFVVLKAIKPSRA